MSHCPFKTQVIGFRLAELYTELELVRAGLYLVISTWCSLFTVLLTQKFKHVVYRAVLLTVTVGHS